MPERVVKIEDIAPKADGVCDVCGALSIMSVTTIRRGTLDVRRFCGEHEPDEMDDMRASSSKLLSL